MTESPSDVEMSDVDNNKERTPSTSTNLPNPPSRVEPAATGSTNPILIRDDVDLKHADLDARIKRCEQRIAIGYATEAFKRKLENLKAKKQRRLWVFPYFQTIIFERAHC